MLTPPEVAKRLRVTADKVRAWIERGELAAVNVVDRLGGRPRWRISAEALAEFEERRTAMGRPARTKRAKKPSELVEYY
jgi:excisionase family DNA binding protein